MQIYNIGYDRGQAVKIRAQWHRTNVSFLSDNKHEEKHSTWQVLYNFQRPIPQVPGPIYPP